MKITVCGKGGCGKSTVTSLLSKALARRGKETLVIDSDESNYGLHRQLGMKLPRDFTDYFGGSIMGEGLMGKELSEKPDVIEILTEFLLSI